MGNLDGKVAFITGAARGQGRSHAVRLAEEGADIIAIDICRQMSAVEYPMSTPEDLAETVRLVEQLDRRIVATQADVRERAELKAGLDAGLAEFGHVDIVLANAGILTSYGDDRVDEEETWRQVIDVDLGGVWRTVNLAVPHMIERGMGGAIVLTSSTSGLKAFDGGGVAFESYTAAKHGVVGLMRSFAKSLAPHSIRVNTVHPTGVSTPMVVNEATQRILAEMDAGSTGPSTLTNMLPVELIDAIDISNAIAWLVSDAARYVTGVALPVDAGFTLR
jgi:SDR family mycofactocin-dependent oxidoreductase